MAPTPHITLAFELLFLAVSTAASPLQTGNNGPNSNPAPRNDPVANSTTTDGGTSNQRSMNPKVWIPLVIAAIVLFCVILLSWTKTSVRRSLSFFGFGSARTSGAPITPTTGPRELTAEELAGAINGDLWTATTAGATPRTRRARRPRRTPSQRSTRSLPAYNKEPGEEEVVIFRGRDAEDVTTMPAARVDNSLDDDQPNNTSALHLPHRDSRTEYAPLSTSAHSDTLLSVPDNNDTTLSLPEQLRQPPGEGMPQRTYDNEPTTGAETRGLLSANDAPHISDITPDVRGEAPPYSAQPTTVLIPTNTTTTTTTLDTTSSTTPTTTTALARADSTSLSPTSQPRSNAPSRSSGFRTLLNRMSISVGPSSNTSTPPTATAAYPLHRRTESENSIGSLAGSHPLARPRSATTVANRNVYGSNTAHRTTPSTSSLFSSSSTTINTLFRPLSRPRSSHTLASAASHSNLRSHNHQLTTSPSMISLNSISPPLTHTAVRTEFTFPKTGPTPQQVRVIASRESVGRFGVPFGDDAVRYAAEWRSTGQVGDEAGALNEEPPPFEDVALDADSSGPGSSSGDASGSTSGGLLGVGHGLGGRTRTVSAMSRLTNVEPLDEEREAEADEDENGDRERPSRSSTVVIVPSTHRAVEHESPTSITATTPSSSSLPPTTSAPTSAPAPLSVSEFGALTSPMINPSTATSPSATSTTRSSTYSNQTYTTAIMDMDTDNHSVSFPPSTSHSYPSSPHPSSSAFDVDLEFSLPSPGRGARNDRRKSARSVLSQTDGRRRDSVGFESGKGVVGGGGAAGSGSGSGSGASTTAS